MRVGASVPKGQFRVVTWSGPRPLARARSEFCPVLESRAGSVPAVWALGGKLQKLLAVLRVEGTVVLHSLCCQPQVIQTRRLQRRRRMVEDFGTLMSYSSLTSCSKFVFLLEVCSSLWGGRLVFLWCLFCNLSLCVLHMKG